MSDAETTTTKTTTTTSTNKTVQDHDHDRADLELLYKVYVDKRLKSQADFYKSRVIENQSNANFTFIFSTAVMSISALVATVSAVVSSPFFSLLSAILPALAALLAAFRQLYGWERQISIYQDALMGLERVKLITPDKDAMATADLSLIYPSLVTSGEQVFTGEVNQWGQFVQNMDKPGQEDTTDTRATNALMGDLRLTDEQVNTIRKIVAAGTPRAALSDQTITIHPEETTALPSGTTVPPAATAQSAPPAPPASVPATAPIETPAVTIDTAPAIVSTTRKETATIHPQESTSFLPDDGSPAAAQAAPDPNAPIIVTTTRVDTTVVEHVIPPADAPVEETHDQVPAADSPATADVSPTAEVPPAPVTEAPVQEEMSALSPGSMHVETPQASEETDAMASHQEFVNEPPPPEALSSLSPGSMHVDAPEAPPENPDAPPPSTDNG